MHKRVYSLHSHFSKTLKIPFDIKTSIDNIDTMKKSMFVLGLCVFCMVLSAQVQRATNLRQNEVQILLNQARVYEGRNQLTQAIEIYEDLYTRFPADEMVIEAYLRVLFQTSDLEKVHTILQTGKNTLNPFIYAKNNCQYLIKKGEIRSAEKSAIDFLNKNPGVMHQYRDLASIFEMSAQWDSAVNIYALARKVANDPNLHSLELSNAYYNIKNVESFFTESLKCLKANSGYLYYYRTRFKEFLVANPQNIKKLEKLISANSPEQILEIYAFSLVEVKDFAKATTIYEKLPLQKMLTFSDDLYTAGYLDYALSSFQKALPKADNQATYADVQMKMAQIHYEKKQISECKTLLSQVIDNTQIQQPPLLHRTRVNKDARLMMAYLSIEENANIDLVKQWYDSASSFTGNQIEKAEVLFSKSRYLYLKEEYQQAYQTIETAVQGHDISTSIFKQSNFYRWEIALFQNSDARDSLMVECIIYFPEDERMSEMLYLETFLSGLKEELRTQFLAALRLRGLYQHKQAVDTLYELAEASKMDELFLLCYEWILAGSELKEQQNLLTQIENHTFRNPILQDFIFLQATRKIESKEQKTSSISEFLNHHPQNVFSPQLRYLLFGA